MTALPAVIVAHAEERRLAPIEKWLTEGNDPDLRADNGATLMHYALCSTESSPASLPICRLLLAHGSDPNHQPFTGPDSAEWNVLFYAVTATTLQTNKSLELMVMLIRSGARVDVVDVDGEHLLHTCVQYLRGEPFNLRIEVLRLLLSRGAPLLVKDERGRTAEEFAEWLLNTYGESQRDGTVTFLRDVRLAGGWKRYVNAPRASLLILRELCNRGRAAPPLALARLFCTSSDSARPRTRRNPRAPLPTPVFWHVLGYWRSDRDAIA